MQKFLQKECPLLYKNPNEVNELPFDFPKCFPSFVLKRALQFAKMTIENGKHLLIVSKEEKGLTQIAKWISLYFSKKNQKIFYLFLHQKQLLLIC